MLNRYEASTPRKIFVTKNPTFIVGQNPGHEKDFTHSGFAWERNRSAKFLAESIDDYINLFLTNVCPYIDLTPVNISRGVEILVKDVQEYSPKKIICLGSVAYDNVMILKDTHRINPNTEIFRLDHPSYVLRFKKDKRKWDRDIRGILNKYVQ